MKNLITCWLTKTLYIHITHTCEPLQNRKGVRAHNELKPSIHLSISKMKYYYIHLSTLLVATLAIAGEAIISFLQDLGWLTIIKSWANRPQFRVHGIRATDYFMTRKKRRLRIAGIYQDELVDPLLLADEDSLFSDFKGVQLHHKICTSTISQAHGTTFIGHPMVLMHGFGASVFSWRHVMKPLADISAREVVAFDRPAFGLTSRVLVNSRDHSSINPYSSAFSALATVNIIDGLATEKAILVGHSAGAYVAVQTYLSNPHRIAAMILVAPAILAPFTLEKNVMVKEDNTEQNTPTLCLLTMLSHSIFHLLQKMVEVLISVSKKLLSLLILSPIGLILVRIFIDKIGTPIARHSWYDRKQVSDDIIDGYTKPLQSKGWDKALVEFVAALFTTSTADQESALPPLTKRLHEISCPVLIVTGDRDPFTPYWNSEKLAEAIPGARLQVIKKCGHIPHEERPQEFVAIVDEFILKTL